MSGTAPRPGPPKHRPQDLMEAAMVADLERQRRRITIETCDTCMEYVERRLTVIPPILIATAEERGVDPVLFAEQYLWAVHQRHEAGLSLATDGAVA